MPTTASLVQDLADRFHPIGETEQIIVLRIAAAQWRLYRARYLAPGIYRHGTPADVFDRYQSSLERSIGRNLRRLQNLQAARRAENRGEPKKWGYRSPRKWG